MSNSSNIIDLKDIIQTLDECANEAAALDGEEYEDDGKNSAANRALRDRLLYLTDALAMASTQVKGEYWNGRRR